MPLPIPSNSPETISSYATQEGERTAALTPPPLPADQHARISPVYSAGSRLKTAARYPTIAEFYQRRAAAQGIAASEAMQEFDSAKSILKQDSLTIQFSQFLARNASYDEVRDMIATRLRQRIAELAILPAAIPGAISDETATQLNHYVDIKFGPHNHFRWLKYSLKADGGIFSAKKSWLDSDIIMATDSRGDRSYLYQIPAFLHWHDVQALASYQGKQLLPDADGNYPNLLGSGAYADVRIARMLMSNDPYYDAVKISGKVDPDAEDGVDTALTQARNEARIMSTLPDSGYISAHRGFFDQGFETHQLQDLGLSDSYTYQEQIETIVNPDEKILVGNTLAKYYLEARADLLRHNPALSHSDLKPENFVLRPPGVFPPLMLVDWSFCTTLQNYGRQPDGSLIGNGSPRYRDPSYTDRNLVMEKVETFAMGMTIGSIAWHFRCPPEMTYYQDSPSEDSHGRPFVPPWRGYKNTHQLEGDSLNNVYRKLCDRNPARRPSNAETLQFPVFQQVYRTLPYIHTDGKLFWHSMPSRPAE